ncbi:hypothetical protein QNI19_18665 [Cytophagaceae bacterium DM2B3-1]|uniref:Uncharacterized protein n=1 Tax=Xanthocytophaga flava TaxID=3048013 RepID=A0ABT7CMP2_9BACT|nr:hypothetical protein [Xanthocytophaga flavus]MDJ1467596.1 hypothetical protein [Xanthocytophaga flavus]MDJ1494968.1 hypothetical protein [Xanthocytophaga flavus]
MADKEVSEEFRVGRVERVAVIILLYFLVLYSLTYYDDWLVSHFPQHKETMEFLTKDFLFHSSLPLTIILVYCVMKSNNVILKLIAFIPCILLSLVSLLQFFILFTWLLDIATSSPADPPIEENFP